MELEHEYEVDSYYVNIGVGDAAIHVLRWNKELISTILVDGGQGDVTSSIHHTAGHTRRLDDTLHYIRSYHGLNDMPTFNGVVISHWDWDHYGGILKMVHDDLKFTGDDKVRFFAYDDRPNAQKMYPLTTKIYCPDWLDIKSLTGPKCTRTALANTTGWYWLHMEIDLGGNQKRTAKNIALCCDLKSRLLGRNLFNNTIRLGLGRDEFNSPSALVRLNQPDNGNWLSGKHKSSSGCYPGFYCIAVDQTLVNSNRVDAAQNTNSSSIATLLMWGNSEGKVSRISHYCAGDLPSETEALVAQWVNMAVTSIKLSHHGAFNSTPLELLEILKPNKIVVSAGNMYGHPRWETIFRIYAWLMQSEWRPNDGTKPVYSTRFPYYLLQNLTGPGFRIPTGQNQPIGIDAFWSTQPSANQLAFRNEIESLLDPLTLESPFKTFAAKAPATYQDAYNLIMTMVQSCWNAFSHIDNKSHPAMAATHNLAQVANAGLNEIQFIRIISREVGWDGEVGIKFDQRPDVVTKDAPPPARNPLTNQTDSLNISHREEESFSSDPPGGILLAVPNALEEEPFATTSLFTNLISEVPSNDRKVLITQFPAPANMNNPNRPRLPALPNSARGGKNAEVAESGFNPHEMNPGDFQTDINQVRSLKKIDISLLPQPLGDDIYLCSDQVDTGSSNHHIHSLEETNPILPFVAALHYGYLSFEEAGTIIADTDIRSDEVVENHKIAADDEFGKWLTSYFNLSDLSFLVKKKQMTEIQEINLSTSEKIPGALLANAPKQIDLSFSTNSKVMNKTFSPSPSTTPSDLAQPSSELEPYIAKEIDQPGIIYNENALVLGLDTSKSTVAKDVSFSEALTIGGCSGLINPTVLLIFDVLKFDLDLEGDEFCGHRNALWFAPEESYRTNMRLQFKCTSADAIKTWLPLNDTFFHLKPLRLITRKTRSWSKTPDGVCAAPSSQIDIILSCSAIQNEKPISEFQISVELSPTTATFTFQINENPDLNAIISWLVSAAGFDGTMLTTWLSNAQDLIKVLPQPRRIILQYDLNKNGSVIPKLQYARIDLQLGFTIGTNGDIPILFLFTYQYTKGTASNRHSLRGSLWCSQSLAQPFLSSSLTSVETPDPVSHARLLPEWEEYHVFKPIFMSKDQAAKVNQLDALDLRYLISPDSAIIIPDGIPTIVTQASLEISTDGIAISGDISCPSPDAGDFPRPYIGDIKVAAFKEFKRSDGTGGDSSLYLGVQAGLIPSKTSKHQAPATLLGELVYTQGDWVMSGTATNLYVAHLVDFFDSGSRADVVQILDNIHIIRLGLTYTFEKVSKNGKGQGNSFLITGIIAFGAFELNLNFNRGSSGWNFNAGLDLASVSNEGTRIAQPTTVGEIMQSILGHEVDLPEFLLDISISMPKTGSAIGMNCTSIKDTAVLFSAWVNLDDFSFSFVQYKPLGGTAKRILKASVKTLPEISLPLVGDITQPFTEMYFMWVSESASKTTGKSDSTVPGQNMQTGSTQGIAKAELDEINSYLSGLQDANLSPLLFKKTKNVVNPADVVLNTGWHFVVVLTNQQNESEVVMDYSFGKKGDTSKGQDVKSSGDEKDTSNDKPKASSDKKEDTSANKGVSKGVKGEGAPQMAPLKKSQGPLSIKNIGFEYKNDTLSIILDATLELGPVTFTVLDLSLGLEFAKGVNLHNFSIENIHMNLRGLAVGFNKPPVTMAGLYLHYDSSDMEYYAGGIIMGFEPWKFQASGFYGSKKTGNKETSIFVFMKLDGPLITCGFAEVSGITGGFGYNLDLRWPAVQDVPNFPFVSMGQPKGDPAEQLEALLLPQAGGWIATRLGSMWVAAGLKVKAFKVLSVDAVVVVQWSPSVKLGIFGVAVCDVPDTKAEKKFAHLEMGMLATIDPDAGVMRIEAQLSPNSFILDPSCHLRGGFAMYYWWKNPSRVEGVSGHHEDDWVFTAGGYHPNFVVPAHYPNPERLSISWSWNDTVSILGEAYFAITPKVCMGGGYLRATLSLGPLSAFFDASVDFLIKYDPFYFQGESKVSIGVKYDMDLWLVHLHISISIGAILYIEGPPMSGYIHVDFWVFGFDIAFGESSNNEKDKILALGEFYNLVLQAGTGPASLSAPDSSKTSNSAHIFSGETGILAPSKTATPTNTTPWRVQGGFFSFLVSCRFPTNHIAFGDENDAKATQGTDPLYAKPMQDLQALNVVLTIKVQKKNTVSQGKVTLEHDVSHTWSSAQVTKAGPAAIWGLYDPSQDPVKSTKRVDDLLNSSTNTTCTISSGYRLAVPPSKPSVEVIPAFDATRDMRFDLPEKTFPSFQAASDAWQPRSTQPEDIADAYKEVRDKWRGADEQASPANITVWAAALGWGDSDVVKGLTTAAPPILTRDLEELLVMPPLLGLDPVR